MLYAADNSGIPRKHLIVHQLSHPRTCKYHKEVVPTVPTIER
jgi:hypothetical protein